MIRLLSRFAGVSEEQIYDALDKLADDVGEGSAVLVVAIASQVLVVGYIVLVGSLAQ